MMRQMHEEQGNTAVDYTERDKGADPSNAANELIEITNASLSASSKDSLSSDHKELVKKYASVTKELVAKHEARVEENGVGKTIYRDIVNTLHSLAGSPMRVNNEGRYRPSTQKPTTEREQFTELREKGVVLELLMNEPEARAIFKEEFGEAWSEVSDWGAKEWTPFVVEATAVVGSAILGKKAASTLNIGSEFHLSQKNNINNSKIEGEWSAGTSQMAAGGEGAGARSAASLDADESVTMQGGVSAPNNINMRSADDLMGVEPASPELISAVSKKRDVVIAQPGSEDLRMLDYFGAEASVGGVNNTHILLRKNPSKAALLEEFLHGTQSNLGITDRLGTSGLGSAETHVKDFMIRHQKMLGLGDEDVQILQILRDKGL